MNKNVINRSGEVIRTMIYDYIVDYLEDHGYPPSIREIADGVGVRSISTVHHHICIMLKRKELETDAKPGTPRAIRVPGYRFTRGGEYG